MPSLKTYLGHVLAPWPFVIFALSALVGGAIVCPLLGMARGIMVAFDAASIAFIASCAPLFRHNAQQMRQTASQNDANRGFLLLTAGAVTGVILISVAIELSQKGRPHPVDLRLVVVTLCLCWSFSTLVYALHYAHLYYTRGTKDQDADFRFQPRKSRIIGTSLIFHLVWR